MDEIASRILTDANDRMEKSVTHLSDQLRTIRTGRAAPALLEGIRVDYYGSPTPLNQIAHISVPEPRQLLVKPFDASQLKEVERAILGSNLGLTPMSDGKTLRLLMPPLSEEQRKKLVAKIKELCEATRIALRNERRDANKATDAASKDGKLTDDNKAVAQTQIQDALKKAEARVDELFKKKSVEIMED